MPYNRKCAYCGREGVYALGMCKACYSRKRRNGTVEYKERKGPRSQNAKKTLELYRGGMKQTDIARELGITREAVSQTIKRHCKPTRAERIRAMSDEKLAEFLWGVETSGRAYGPLGKNAWTGWLRQDGET